MLDHDEPTFITRGTRNADGTPAGVTVADEQWHFVVAVLNYVLLVQQIIFGKDVRMSARNRNKKGFTLIELLVVIAIIALLLAIVMPSLSKAKEHAKFLICKTNLKQYGYAGMLYLDDNNGRFADEHRWLYKTGGNPWGGSSDYNKEPDGPMWPYLDNKKVHMCPVFEKLANGVYKPSSIPADHKAKYSYSQNGYLGVEDQHWEEVLRIGEVKGTSSIFYFSEENPFTVKKTNAPELSTDWSICLLNDNCLLAGHSGKPIGDCFATYHLPKGGPAGPTNPTGKAVAVFLDGHVEAVYAYDTEEKAWPFSAPYPYRYRESLE